MGYGGGSCTHTHSNQNAWWRVDLQSTRRIEKVEVWNRGDCCGSRLNGFEVHVSNHGGYKLIKSRHECKSGDTHLGSGLSAAECAAKTRARGGKFFVIGVGSKAGACYQENTSSASCPQGWESDQYDFYEVDQSQQTCGGKNNVGQGQMKSVACGGKSGRYVKVVLAGRSDYLTLCEVKVWARDDAAPTLKCTLRSTEVRSYARGFFGTKDQAIPNSWATPNPCHATNCGSTGSKTCAGRGQCRYEGSKSGSINTGCDCNSGWRDNKCETPNNYGKVQLYLKDAYDLADLDGWSAGEPDVVVFNTLNRGNFANGRSYERSTNRRRRGGATWNQYFTSGVMDNVQGVYLSAKVRDSDTIGWDEFGTKGAHLYPTTSWKNLKLNGYKSDGRRRGPGYVNYQYRWLKENKNGNPSGMTKQSERI